MCIIGNFYDYNETVAWFGGGNQSYLPLKKGRVLGGRFKFKMNSAAPDVVVVGNKDSVVKKTDIFSTGGYSIPVFTKKGKKKWKYMGMYKFKDRSDDPAVIAAHNGGRTEIDSILFLEHVP